MPFTVNEFGESVQLENGTGSLHVSEMVWLCAVPEVKEMVNCAAWPALSVALEPSEAAAVNGAALITSTRGELELPAK